MGAADQYAEALAGLAHDQVNRMEDVIQDMRTGVIDAAQARVEMDARKWFASKFLPKRYSDKINLAHEGEVGLTVNVVNFTDSD